MQEHQSSRLAEVLGELAVEMQGKTSADTTLYSIIDGSVRIIPGARWAGISLVTGREVKAQSPSDALAAELDQLQSVLGDGPCINALRDHHTVRIDDMTAETRWPKFTQVALERGVRSMLSFQLFVEKDNLGALNLYSDEVDAFDPDAELIGEVLAQHASVAMAASAAESQFHIALDSRDVIAQAKGLLMQRNNATGLHAFNMLVEASKSTNVKLVDIARWLVSEHEKSATN